MSQTGVKVRVVSRANFARADIASIALTTVIRSSRVCGTFEARIQPYSQVSFDGHYFRRWTCWLCCTRTSSEAASY